MKGILGTKVGMTQVFTSEGILVPVTVVHAEPNLVLSVRTKEKDGYVATQLAYREISPKNVNKPDAGQFKKANAKPRRHINEIRDMTGYEAGGNVDVSVFKVGEYIDVEGLTRGRGTTGAIRRWNMKIGPMSHGAGYPHRFQGSLGGGRGGASAQHVFKGKKMAGRYGHEQVTIENLVVVAVDEEKNTLMIKGSIPGPRHGLVRVLQAQKRPKDSVAIDLVDLKLEARKNALLEEARRLGIQLDLHLPLKEMQRLVDEAAAVREKEEKEKEAAEAAAAEAADKAAQAEARAEAVKDEEQKAPKEEKNHENAKDAEPKAEKNHDSKKEDK